MPRDGTERIRSIDPGFWAHPKTLAVMEKDPLAVLLLIGIRSRPVDDAGRFRADPRSLKAQILPFVPQAETEWVRGALALLEELGCVHLYQVAGAQYGVVHDWRDWQKIDRPSKSVLPPPPTGTCRCCHYEESELIAEPSTKSSEDAASTSEASRKIALGGEGRGGDRRGEDVPPSKQATGLDWYADRSEKEFGKRPLVRIVTQGAVCAAAEREYGAESVHAAFEAYLRNRYWRKRGCPLSDFFTERVLAEMMSGEGATLAHGPPPEVDVL